MSGMTVVDKPTILALWEDKKEIIRETFAPNLTTLEFDWFMQMGISLELNPFLREIWAVKYDKSKPAQIFIGRDGYRRVIGRNPAYINHFVEALCSNDEFEILDIDTGKFRHKFDFKNRGKIVGAYCFVYMKGSTRPYYVRVDFTEYDLNQGLWKSKRETMIKKVAESQCIRMACPNLNGTYSDEERWFDEDGKELRQVSSRAEFLNQHLGLTPIEPDEVVIETVTEQESSIAHIFEGEMMRASTLHELKEIGVKIGVSDVTQEEKQHLQEVYRVEKNRIVEEQAERDKATEDEF
jgi:phage recombination protein Bet